MEETVETALYELVRGWFGSWFVNKLVYSPAKNQVLMLRDPESRYMFESASAAETVLRFQIAHPGEKLHVMKPFHARRRGLEDEVAFMFDRSDDPAEIFRLAERTYVYAGAAEKKETP